MADACSNLEQEASVYVSANLGESMGHSSEANRVLQFRNVRQFMQDLCCLAKIHQMSNRLLTSIFDLLYRSLPVVFLLGRETLSPAEKEHQAHSCTPSNRILQSRATYLP